MSEDQHRPHPDEDLVAIYAATNAMEADRIVLMLKDEGIEHVLKQESSISEIPTVGTQSFLIAVLESDREKAQSVIRQAIEDGVLPKGGTLL